MHISYMLPLYKISTITVYLFFQDKDKLIANLKTIQDYLCSFNSQVPSFGTFARGHEC